MLEALLGTLPLHGCCRLGGLGPFALTLGPGAGLPCSSPKQVGRVCGKRRPCRSGLKASGPHCPPAAFRRHLRKSSWEQQGFLQPPTDFPCPVPRLCSMGAQGSQLCGGPLLNRWLRSVMHVTQASHLGVPSQGKKRTQGGAVHFQGAQRLAGVCVCIPSCPHTQERGTVGGGREPRSLAEKLMPSWTLPALPLHLHPFTLSWKAGGDPRA